jgi:hypothetical protein
MGFALLGFSASSFTSTNNNSKNSSSSTNTPSISSSAAYTLLALSLFILLYAARQYYYRGWLIMSKAPRGYHDQRGPCLLVTFLVLAICINIGIYESSNASLRAGVVTGTGGGTSPATAGFPGPGCDDLSFLLRVDATQPSLQPVSLGRLGSDALVVAAKYNFITLPLRGGGAAATSYALAGTPLAAVAGVDSRVVNESAWALVLADNTLSLYNPVEQSMDSAYYDVSAGLAANEHIVAAVLGPSTSGGGNQLLLASASGIEVLPVTSNLVPQAATFRLEAVPLLISAADTASVVGYTGITGIDFDPTPSSSSSGTLYVLYTSLRQVPC